MGLDLGGLLQQVLGAVTADNAPKHFDQVAQNTSPDLLSQGLAAMFRSDQTPAFGEMAAQLFGQSNPNQQAGLLGQLLGSLGPDALQALLGGAGGAGLAGVLGQLAQGGGVQEVTPEQASQFTPEQVQAIADHAEQNNPDVIDSISGFYAEHSTLIKTLGGAALTIALAKIAEHNKQA